MKRRSPDHGLRYLALFALVGAEGLGIPPPGETALIIAGAYALAVRAEAACPGPLE